MGVTLMRYFSSFLSSPLSVPHHPFLLLKHLFAPSIENLSRVASAFFLHFLTCEWKKHNCLLHITILVCFPSTLKAAAFL
jgi:hypothetical protein